MALSDVIDSIDAHSGNEKSSQGSHNGHAMNSSVQMYWFGCLMWWWLELTKNVCRLESRTIVRLSRISRSMTTSLNDLFYSDYLSWTTCHSRSQWRARTCCCCCCPVGDDEEKDFDAKLRTLSIRSKSAVAFITTYADNAMVFRRMSSERYNHTLRRRMQRQRVPCCTTGVAAKCECHGRGWSHLDVWDVSRSCSLHLYCANQRRMNPTYEPTGTHSTSCCLWSY